MKRAFDILISSILILVLLPVLLVVAIAILVNSGSPVLFGQIRVGKGGGEFKLLKFRSMVVDAENLGSYSTSTNDPRITGVGRFIRRTSLDELPQLLNVLAGDMSLVGPRPDVPLQKSGYTEDDWNLRISVRPGITGLAQATLRSAATVDERLALDLDYVHTNGLMRDIAILLKTAIQLLRKGGN